MKRWLAALLLIGLGAGALLLLLRLQPALLPAAAMRDDELFTAWRAGAAGADVAAIEAYLAREGVGDVLPLADILRSDARWRTCPEAQPFAVPPRKLWPAMVPTLRYVRDHVVPAVGPVRVVSGYRDPVANVCFKGAKASRHLRFAALDLMPVRRLGRAELIATLCPLHTRTGARDKVGLGIYTVTRFHIDTAGYRRWGADYRGASSPCLTRS
ncbi:MAG TPA: D-Ala-D-Ala carboxypeptidase family metallohydrolase [Sphingopyxis sp.]|nr:D-Ala-D-Ala carboxypeptidase family metallohydrolase [Sphingopyxis sp.]HMP43763.1 D-Ala-D-Ala carboxypeptidase family metallohydrolase [Sphingopyxis sp.]HMQ17536.1 D-Ala-D-Ala carboxypeptidase family metallohydrolase [Sphingopyxis sp.]